MRHHEGPCHGMSHNVEAFANGGITLCGGWFLLGRRGKAETIVHELSHLLADSKDEAFHGQFSGNYIGDAPGTTNPRGYSRGWRPLDPTRHADSLAMFAIIYWVP